MPCSNYELLIVMIMKKYVLTIVALVLVAAGAQSQGFKETLTHAERVCIRDLYGNIEVVAGAGNEIVVEKIGQARLPEDARKAKPSAYNDDNTGQGINFNFANRQVVLSPSEKESQFADYRITVPDKVDLSLTNESLYKKIAVNNYQNKEIFNRVIVEGVNGEIVVDVFSSDVYLNEVTGPLAIAIFYGNCKVDFAKLNQEFPSVIDIYLGNIDVILPEKTPFFAQLEAKGGGIFSEFDIDLKEKEVPLSVEERFFYGVDGKLGEMFFHDDTPNTGKEYEASKVVGLVNGSGVSVRAEVHVGYVNLKKR